MVFSSVEFLYFYLPAVLLIYRLTPKKLKNAVLFASGLIFYAFGEPVYVFVLVASCLIDYFAGLIMSRCGERPKARRACLIVSVVMNLGLLGIFKYTSFIIETLNGVFGLSLPLNIYAGAANTLFGAHFSLSKIILPIGISFFTFQSMSYTIDLYLGKIEVQRNFIDFAAYVTMFPQIVAGPIVRYKDVENELRERSVSLQSLSDGVTRFTRGLAKKVLLANNIGLLWQEVKASDYSALPALTAWLGIIAFTLQIYFDFSGYSDMAVGLGKMLGFSFPENFNLPYTSKSVREFWRRWHITLGDWFKSYVYIPLGGSRGGALKTVRNLAIVWLLTGLWHGASWNFVLWGAWFGVLIVAERLFLGRLLEKLPGFFSWLYTMLAVIFGWVLFEMPGLSETAGFIKAMFGAGGAAWDQNTAWLICEYSIIISLCAFFASDAPKNIKEKLNARLQKAGLKPDVFSAAEPFVTALLLICSTAYLVSEGYNPFLYFNF